MSEWNRFSSLIGLLVGTGFIRHTHAVSALFVGQPGSGKSSAILRFKDVRTCFALSDLTAGPLRTIVLPMVRDKGYRHLLFPDFWKLFQRKDFSVGNVVGTLTALMSGELQASLVGQEQGAFPNIQAGVIGAMPTPIFRRWHTDMGAQGLLDRMIVFPWDFSKDEQARIERQILDGTGYDLRPFPFPDIPQPVTVHWNAKLKPVLMDLVDSIKKEQRNRLVGALRTLTLSATMLRGLAHGEPNPYTATRDALDLVATYAPEFRKADI